jgi:hypothetical protein
VRRAVSVAALIAAGLVCVRIAWSPRPRVLCAVGGSARSPLAISGQRIAWLEGDERESRLMVIPHRGGRARAVLVAPRVAGLALERDAAYVTRGAGAAGMPPALLAVSLKTGAAKTVAGLPEEADQIVCSDRWLVWRRSRRPGLSGIPFVAAAAPVTVIRSAPAEGGPVRVIAVLRGETSFRKDDIALLGVAGDSIYWRQRSGPVANDQTLIRRAPCAGGKVATLVAEAGSRGASLAGDVLVWTAPSLEAGNPGAFATVKRMALGRSGVEVIADWLDPGAMPMLTAGGRVYAQERGSLWRLGEKRAEQRRLFSGPSQLMSPVVSGDEEFMFIQRGQQMMVAKRPLTLWARVRSAVEW